MREDYRNDPLFSLIDDMARSWLQPGSGETCSISQIAVSPDKRYACASATVCEALEGIASTRIALIDLATGQLSILPSSRGSDSSPKWSPDGGIVAFLSDRERGNINRLRLLNPQTGEDTETPSPPGFVEFLHWSPDGSSILLGVAGFGSDLAGVQGATTTDREDDGRPDWAPMVEITPALGPWRSLWLYNLGANSINRLTEDGVNVWEATWCGQHLVAAICSDSPEEASWYTAEVRSITIDGKTVKTIFRPATQLGWIVANPSGKSVAVIEALCSDRGAAVGDLRLIDVATGDITKPTTLGADVVQMIWRGDAQVLFAAAQGPDSLIGLLDTDTLTSRELWRGHEQSPSGSIYPEIAALGQDASDVLFLREGFFEPPVLVAIEHEKEREILRLGATAFNTSISRLGSARDVRWTAPDGMEIHGWLLTPPGEGPHPLILQIHGGPVHYYRPTYVGRSLLVQMLLSQGFAVFQPNVRGSSGRGQAFARHVLGDMGGKDADDHLSGLDALINDGLADPDRIGVTGGSYGGFMTSWLITRDQRFAAAVSVSPISNWVSQYLTCHIASFCEIFLDASLVEPNGQHFNRSPVHFADRVTTPTLSICGQLDRVTPPGQALEFHHALQIAGVESALVTYPREGHGIRKMPASFDFVARAVHWFQTHIPHS